MRVKILQKSVQVRSASKSMEDKRGDAGTQPPANADSPATEPTSSRRRAGGQKRKASSLGGSASSSTPSKRLTREKAPLSHAPIHNGPLTRARQGPSSHSSASAAASKPAAQTKRPEPTSLEAEQAKRESELEALEAAMEAEFEAIRSRDANAHVVPSHCGETNFQTLIIVHYYFLLTENFDSFYAWF